MSINITRETSFDRCIICGWMKPLAAPYPAELCVVMVCDRCFGNPDNTEVIARKSMAHPGRGEVTVRVAARDRQPQNVAALGGCKSLDEFIANHGVEAYKALPRTLLKNTWEWKVR